MRKPPMPDCYDYVRRYYGVPAYIGARVRIENREGVLVRSNTGHYVEVRFDGERRASGPYHPTDGVEYLAASPIGAGIDEQSQDRTRAGWSGRTSPASCRLTTDGRLEACAFHNWEPRP